MHSLTVKLTFAFLLVSVTGVLLVALFIRRQTEHEFGQFVLSRYQVDLVSELAGYYEQRGSWEGFQTIVTFDPRRRQGGRLPVAPAPVTLVDAGGNVIYSRNHELEGVQLQPEELARAAPINVDEQLVGWVIFDSGGGGLAFEESPESEFLANVNRAVVLGVLGAVLISLLLGILLARTISRPVREVTAATKVVAAGELGVQVPVRTRDELGELASSFNQMSADLARSNEQRRQMTADIAHDLRTPLSVILGYMEALSEGKLEPSPQTFDIMYAKGRHLQHLIDDLRILALADAGELTLTRRPISPAWLLEHTALTHMMQAEEKGISLRVEEPAAEESSLVNVDPERMGQVLSNLVSNALRYTPAGGKIVLAQRQNGQKTMMSVADSGAGIDPEDLPHIFDRFYRSDKARSQGSAGRQSSESGLGLAIARSIVEAHGGSLTVDSTLGEGACFTITLLVLDAG